MLAELKELWKFRELLISMVQRELRVRYKNSVLGVLWSFINPIVTTAVLWLVFGKILGGGTNSFAAYIAAAYLPFTFFQMAVLDSAQSVLASLGWVKKVYFPREILPLATVLSNFIHLLVGLVVFFLFMLAVWIRDPRVVPFQLNSIYLPFLLAVLLMMAIGTSLIVSALNTLYEDVKYVVGIFMYLMFFLTPIMYFAEEVAASKYNVGPNFLLYKIYYLNPLAVFCTAFRKLLLAPTEVTLRDGRVMEALPLPVSYLVYTAVLSVVMMIGGYALFNRLKWRFVERP